MRCSIGNGAPKVKMRKRSAIMDVYSAASSGSPPNAGERVIGARPVKIVGAVFRNLTFDAAPPVIGTRMSIDSPTKRLSKSVKLTVTS